MYIRIHYPISRRIADISTYKYVDKLFFVAHNFRTSLSTKKQRFTYSDKSNPDRKNLGLPLISKCRRNDPA